MEEQLVSFETAKLAKEKGFDIKTIFYYDGEDSNKLEEDSYAQNWNKINYLISAPTQSLLQKWLREKHNIHIEIVIDDNQKNSKEFYYVRIFYIQPMKYIGRYGHENYTKSLNYEEALEEGLQQALKLL